MAKYFFALGFPFVDDENAQQEQLYRALERNKDKAPVAMTVYLLRTRGGRLLTVCEWPVERDSEIEANGGLWGEGSMFRQWIGQAGGPMYQDADILGPRTHGVQEIDRPSDRSSEIVSSFSAGHPSTLGQTWKTEVTPKQKEGAVASAACPFKNDKGECVPPGERSGPACSFQLSDYERLCAVYPDHAAAAAGKHVSLREAVEEQDRRALAMQRELEERAKGPSAAEDQLLWEQLCSDKPTLLFFRAERRGGSEGAAELSAAMAPLFVHLSDDYGDRVRFIPVNADDYPDLPAKLGEHVMPIPCFALVRGGKVLGKYMGEGDEVEEFVRKRLDEHAPPASKASVESLESARASTRPAPAVAVPRPTAAAAPPRPSVETEAPIHAARLHIPYPERLSRWLIFVKWLLAIPHLVVLFLYTVAAWFAAIVAWLAILFVGKQPRGLFDFIVSYDRYWLRTVAYVFLLTDKYPPFDSRPGQHPVEFEVDYPHYLSRGLIFVKWLLVIPHFIVLWIYLVAMLGASIVAWFAILFTAKYPRGLFDFVAGYLRWMARVLAYSGAFAVYSPYVGGLLTDQYPPFSNRADRKPLESAEAPATDLRTSEAMASPPPRRVEAPTAKKVSEPVSESDISAQPREVETILAEVDSIARNHVGWQGGALQILDGGDQGIWATTVSADIARLMELDPENADYQFAQVCALDNGMQFATAEQRLREMLAQHPDHLEGRRMLNWGQRWLHPLVLPPWDEKERRVPDQMKSAGVETAWHSVRVGVRRVVSAFLPPEACDLRGPATAETRCKIEPLFIDTPFAPIVAIYVIVEDDPADPLKVETFLDPVQHPGFPTPWDCGDFLIQHLAQQDFTYVVAAIAGQVRLNRKVVFDAQIRSKLQKVADRARGLKPGKLDSQAFKKAAQWQMEKFSLDELRF